MVASVSVKAFVVKKSADQFRTLFVRNGGLCVRKAFAGSGGWMDEEIRKKLVALIPRLRRQARFMVGDPELADDLVQEALTRGISKIHTWQPGTNLDAWMITVLRNVIITQWRQLRRRQLVELEEDRMWIPAGQESRLALGELRRALQQLTPGHKQILLLIAVEGLSYEE